MTYVVSPHTLYDSDAQLFYTEIGQDNLTGPKLITCWAKTEALSRIRANNLATKFNLYNYSHRTEQPTYVPDVPAQEAASQANYVMLFDGGRLMIELKDTTAAPTFVLVNDTVYVPKVDIAPVSPSNGSNLADKQGVSPMPSIRFVPPLTPEEMDAELNDRLNGSGRITTEERPAIDVINELQAQIKALEGQLSDMTIDRDDWRKSYKGIINRTLSNDAFDEQFRNK